MLSKNDRLFWADVFTESYIAIALFSIFIALVFIYLIIDLEENNYVISFVNSLELYLDKQELTVLVNNSIFKNLMDDTKQKSIQVDIDNKPVNKKLYETEVFIVVVYVIAFFCILIMILEYVLHINILSLNWKKLGIITLICASFIILYELIFIYFCFGKYIILRVNYILKLLLDLSII